MDETDLFIIPTQLAPDRLYIFLDNIGQGLIPIEDIITLSVNAAIKYIKADTYKRNDLLFEWENEIYEDFYNLVDGQFEDESCIEYGVNDICDFIATFYSSFSSDFKDLYSQDYYMNNELEVIRSSLHGSSLGVSIGILE